MMKSNWAHGSKNEKPWASFDFAVKKKKVLLKISFFMEEFNGIFTSKTLLLRSIGRSNVLPWLAEAN